MARARITPVVLCGGSGTRLWPLSRAGTPKPFLALIGKETLFQQAVDRCSGPEFEKPVVVTGAAHLPLVEAQVEQERLGNVIVEPEPKQTAAAVGLAALRLPPDAVMLVCPSDHHIEDQQLFRAAAVQAAKLATEGWLVCLGIAAAEPKTRFGYIQRGEQLAASSFKVARFVEKPDRAAAETYVASAEFAWNGGIFAFRAGDYLSELERHRPALAALVRDAVAAGGADESIFSPDAAIFSRIEAESLDYAVMENSDRAAVVMTNDMGWTDVGDWRTLYLMREKDAAGNTVRGPAELLDCRNVLVETDGPAVHLIGLENVIVVIDGEDVLIANAESASSGSKLRGARSMTKGRDSVSNTSAR